MSILTKILTVSFLVSVCLLASCEIDRLDGKTCSDAFFKNILLKNYTAAAKMIDSRAPFYRKRDLFIDHLAHDSIFGDLTEIGGLMMRASTGTSTLDFASWTSSEKLHYDTVSVIIEVTVVDRGNGPKIFNIKRRKTA